MMLTKRSTLGASALLALALLFVGLTILFSFLLSGWRLDLTENKLYSTAPGTVKILKNLKEPITLHFFFSEKAASPYPALKTYGTRVNEFLQELAARSDGNIRLRVIDPEPFSEDEDRAAELGVRGMPSGTAGGPPIYFGLAATNSTDGRANIEFFDPSKEEFLEYDVVKLIHQLANPKKPVVGWLSGIPMTPAFDPQSGREGSLPVVYSQAQQLFDVRTLSAVTDKDLADLSVLVIVHPKDLPLATQFAIDQYALRGGHIIAFVDPLAEQDPAGKQQQQYMAQGQMMDPGNVDTSSNLEKLLQAWGVDFDNRKVVGDLELAMQVGMRPGAAPVRHLGILGLDQRSFDKKDVVTAGLSNINVATAGFLSPRKGSGIKFEPLLQTSSNAGPLPKERFNMMMMHDPSSLLDGFAPTGQQYTIAARVTGKVKTAFAGGAPTGVTLPEGQRPLTESAKPLNLIVVADTDLLSDFMWVRVQNFFGSQMAQAFANNGDFVFNALDNLAGSEDLISVRGRATFTRPFVVVNKLRANAESRFRAKEQELESQLNETEQKLSQLESKRDEKSSSLLLTPEQERELDRFQQEKLRIRKELRSVRLGLDQDIKGLGAKLKFLNIVVVPLVFALVALAVVTFRNQKRRRIAAKGSQA